MDDDQIRELIFEVLDKSNLTELILEFTELAKMGACSLERARFPGCCGIILGSAAINYIGKSLALPR